MNRCGGLFGQGSIVSGGMTMDRLVLSLTCLAGRQVIDRTGLQGDYASWSSITSNGRPRTNSSVLASSSVLGRSLHRPLLHLTYVESFVEAALDVNAE